MLEAYNVRNTTIMVDDKERLHELPMPFLAEVANGLAIVRKVSENEVSLLWNGETVSVDSEDFIQSWTSVSMFFETTAASGEPHYRKHRKSELLKRFEKLVLIVSILIVTCFGASRQLQYFTWTSALVCILCALGAFISYMLLGDGVLMGAADKVCSLFSKGNCKKVRASHHAAIYGYKLSEIGISFFLTSFLLLLALPSVAAHWFPVVFCLTLPFTAWSLWTQGVRLKAWCPLCIATVVILWMLVAITAHDLPLLHAAHELSEVFVVLPLNA